MWQEDKTYALLLWSQWWWLFWIPHTTGIKDELARCQRVVNQLMMLLVLDPIAEMYVIGCTVDYVTEFGGSYLKVINPNATASCGCGESFAV